MASTPAAVDNAYAGLHYKALSASPTNLCAQLPPASCAQLLPYVNVYINDFFVIVQGGPAEQRQVWCHLFCNIDSFLHPNDGSDTSLQEPNSTKKLYRGGTAWTTRKCVLGW